MKRVDPVELCCRLIEFDTSNPPGNEVACARFLGQMLSDAGFNVQEHSFGLQRVNLVARKGHARARHSLCFVGHLDTVPMGARSWKHPPFSATLDGERLYGRGSCDMKSGVAAFVTAAIRAANDLDANASLTLVFPGGEETGCEGSLALVRGGMELSGFDGIIVAEPTDNKPLLGHKGALWLRVHAKGVAAHGAMPHNGVNAAVKAARMILRLQDFCGEMPVHPVLGRPTISIGQVRAGHAVNVVPDFADIDIDLRTTPGISHDALRKRLVDVLSPDIDDVETLVSMQDVFTEPEQSWVQSVFGIVRQETGQDPGRETASYFTDASALAAAAGSVPILILGPGSPGLMHQTDEYCDISQILAAERIYANLIAQTLGAPKSARVALQEQQ